MNRFYFDLTAYEHEEYKQLQKKMLGNNDPKLEKDILRFNYLRNKRNDYLGNIGEKQE